MSFRLNFWSSSETNTGPYEILVRELVAVDGVDSSEILLIDSQGCPTDASIMGVVSRVNGNGQQLEAPFDAFKFPSSDVVQFRALVTPCVPACEPVTCNIVNPETGLNKEAMSYGRRRRSARSAPRNTTGNPEEVVVVGAIKITDTFDYKTDSKDGRPRAGRRDPEQVGIFEEKILTESAGNCTDFMGLVVTFVIFLIAQLTLIVAWYYVYRIKIQRKLMMSSKLSGVTASGLSPMFAASFPGHHHQHHAASVASFGPSSYMSTSEMLYGSHGPSSVPASSSSSSSVGSHHNLQHAQHGLKFNSMYKM